MPMKPYYRYTKKDLDYEFERGVLCGKRVSAEEVISDLKELNKHLGIKKWELLDKWEAKAKE